MMRAGRSRRLASFARIALAWIARSAAATSLALAGAAHAHHGGGAYWAGDRHVGPLTGVATKFSFTFPHVAIYVDVTGENNVVEQYAMTIRWTPTVLRKLGWNRDSIEPGDELTFSFTPHVENPTIGSLSSLEVNGAPMPLEPDGDAGNSE